MSIVCYQKAPGVQIYQTGVTESCREIQKAIQQLNKTDLTDDNFIVHCDWLAAIKHEINKGMYHSFLLVGCNQA